MSQSRAERSRAGMALLALGAGWLLPVCSCAPDPNPNPGPSGGAAGVGGASGAGGGSGAPADASSDASDASDAGDASEDAAGDAPPPDGSTPDATVDAPWLDSHAESAPDAPLSQFCGDGIRDPVTEECDDGTDVNPPDSCNAQCVVQDVLVVPSAGPTSSAKRVLGAGRHPVGAGAWGFAVAYVEYSGASEVGVRLFDPDGVPGAVVSLSKDTTTLDEGHPVVASLGGSKLAVAYTDFGADGDGRGVALRVLDAPAGTAGPVVRVNTTTAFNQRDADLVWTGSELVAAWVDDSKLWPNGLDVKFRTFGPSGAPTGAEQVLAGTTAHESHVSLAPAVGGGTGAAWAAAWRSVTGTTEQIMARAGTTMFSVAVAAPGPAPDQPALVNVGSGLWLLVFTEGGGAFGVPRLRGAVLDVTSPGAVTSFALPPLVAPHATDPSLGQSEPALARVGDQVFLAWRSSAVPADANAEDLWLKQITITTDAGGVTLGLSSPEIPLPRHAAHTFDDQRRPALAATPLFPGGALATAWDDYGRVFGPTQGQPDVVAELIPVPILRTPLGGGGQ